MIKRESDIYNTPVEVAIRLLTIIVKYKSQIDFEKLIILDYLSLHANVVCSEFESIHPDNPFHGLEVYSKMEVSKKAINLLISKGLIDVEFTTEGISYNYNVVSEHFLSYFDGEYYEKLKLNIDKVLDFFASYSSSDLQNYLYDNMSSFGGKKIDLTSIYKEEVN